MVLFTDLLTDDEIEALIRDILLTPDIALFRQPDPIRLKSVSPEERSTNKAFPFPLALASSVKYTNLGHQKHDFQPQLWNHFEMTVKGSFMALRLRTYHHNSKYFKSLIMILRGGMVNALYNF